jgi:hypothetical protein
MMVGARTQRGTELTLRRLGEAEMIGHQRIQWALNLLA